MAPIFARFLYPWADGIVAASQGVAEDLTQTASLPLVRIQTIYNPVISPEMFAQAQELVNYPWFNLQHTLDLFKNKRTTLTEVPKI
ncbi:MAG: hypothetical protein WCA35_24255 [Kovacikia sp.]